MVCAGVEDAEGQTSLGEVHSHRLHHGLCGAGEVDGDDVAHAGSHLVHQAAGLAEVDVLSPLADLRDGDGGDLLGHKAVVQDDADEHLKGGRRGDTASLRHVGRDVNVQTGQLCAPLGEGGALAAQQGGGGVLLFLVGLEVVQINDAQIIALALDAELVLVVGGCGGDHVDVHAAGQHPAMLIVGVVAADLGAARCAVKAGLSVGAEGLFQPVQHGGVTGGFGGRLGWSTAIQGGEARGVDAVGQLLLPYGNGLHHGIFLLTDRYFFVSCGRYSPLLIL